MTKKQFKSISTLKIGEIIQSHRKALLLNKSARQYFIDDRVNKNILPYDWISEKSLSNIENGYNMPSLSTLKLLSIALEVDFIDLLKEIENFILIDTPSKE